MNYDILRVLIDNGSSMDILFYDIFNKMNLSRDHLQKTSSPLIGFSRDVISMEGMTTLPISTS